MSELWEDLNEGGAMIDAQIDALEDARDWARLTAERDALQRDRDRALNALRSLYSDFARMPGTVHYDTAAVRDWWFDTMPSRAVARDLLAAFDEEQGR